MTQVWERAQERQLAMLAALRADLHNTSARQFEHFYEPEEFMPGHQQRIEDRVRQLMETGQYTASQAVAIVTSRQSREHQIHLVNGLKNGKRKRMA